MFVSQEENGFIVIKRKKICVTLLKEKKVFKKVFSPNVILKAFI